MLMDQLVWSDAPAALLCLPSAPGTTLSGSPAEVQDDRYVQVLLLWNPPRSAILLG